MNVPLPIRRRGFTLIEVILAVAIVGLTLTAATTLLVAVSNAWLLRDERAFLEEHVGGLTQFLTVQFEQAGQPIQVAAPNRGGAGGNVAPPNAANPANPQNPGSPQISVEVRPNTGNRPNARPPVGVPVVIPDFGGRGVRWETLPGAPTMDDPVLHFVLSHRPPALLADLPADRGVRAFLRLDPEAGLVLHWESGLAEERAERLDDMQTMTLSRWIRGIDYIYFDPDMERWEESAEVPRDRQREPILPSFIRLRFEHQGVESAAIIPIPPTVEGVPLF